MKHEKMPIGQSCLLIACLAVCSWIAVGGLIWMPVN